MKMFTIAALITLASISEVESSWEEITQALEGKIVNESQSDKSKKYVEVTSDQSLVLNIKKNVSIKFFVASRDSVSMQLSKDNNTIKKITLKKGGGEFKNHFEPGTYQFKGSSTVKVRAYRWKKVKLDNIIPEGGGYPEIMVHKNKQYEYYTVSNSSKPSFIITGPAVINIYSRLRLPADMFKMPIQLIVAEKNNTVLTNSDTLERSRYVTLQSDTTAALTEASVTQFRVPKGVHKYSITYKNSGAGLVKIYKEHNTTTLSSPSSIKKVFGSFKVIADKSSASLSGKM